MKLTDTESMILEIMKPKFQLYETKDYKKYENKNFLILKNQKTILVVDNRYNPPQIHSNLLSAYEKIKKAS